MKTSHHTRNTPSLFLFPSPLSSSHPIISPTLPSTSHFLSNDVQQSVRFSLSFAFSCFSIWISQISNHFLNYLLDLCGWNDGSIYLSFFVITTIFLWIGLQICVSLPLQTQCLFARSASTLNVALALSFHLGLGGNFTYPSQNRWRLNPGLV